MVKQGSSQLAQLKSALHSSGLARTSNPKSKKRKRGDDEGSTYRKDQKAARLQEITSKLNPFDLKVTKLKHDIPGQKIKGVIGRPASSKQLGIQQRKKTLLVEYKEKGRAGGVIDKRYGEKNSNLTQEQRMLGRFTHERQKSAKVSFNLEEDEELTHYGQSLNATDDFEKTGLALEPDEEDVDDEHFGGFDEDGEEEDPDAPPRKKSKAEIMAEVMEKSKRHKHERQAQKDSDENLRHQVDQELDDIHRLLLNMPEDSLGVPSKSTLKVAEPSSDPPLSSQLPKSEKMSDDQYDRVLRELVFEKRAKPTDRLKTEEEVAAEEKRLLEKAERARIRRMNGEEDYDSEDEKASNLRKRKRVPQADDLEDDFVAEEEEVFLGAGLEGAGSEDGSASDEDSEASESGTSEDDASEINDLEDGSLGGDLSQSDSDASVSGDEEELVDSSKLAPSSRMKGKAKELPFTFECPETHEDFLDIIADVDDDDIVTVVQRIRALYHPSLGEGNKAKLEVLTTILIEHALYTAATSTNPFPLVASLSPQIFGLTKIYTIATAKTFISKLVIMQKNLARGLAMGPTSSEAKTFPGIPELTLLRLVGTIWSTSDRWHPVAAPAMLLMGQYLGQGRVRSLRDLASGLFLCTLFLQYQTLSRRLVPETVNFLLNAVLHLSPHNMSPSDLPGYFPSPDLNTESTLSLKLDPKHSATLTAQAPNLSTLLQPAKLSKQVAQQSKVDLLSMAFSLMGRVAEMYGSLDGFIEMFEPAHAILEKIDTAAFSSDLNASHSTLTSTLERRLKFARQSRQPLHLQAHKPIAIASIAPRFDLNYSGRVFDDSPGAQASKLNSLYKKEKKSAVRELRRDAKFLAVEKAQQQAKKDKDYQDKMIRAVGAISNERAEEKMMDRMKAIDKLRAAKYKKR